MALKEKGYFGEIVKTEEKKYNLDTDKMVRKHGDMTQWEDKTTTETKLTRGHDQGNRQQSNKSELTNP